MIPFGAKRTTIQEGIDARSVAGHTNKKSSPFITAKEAFDWFDEVKKGGKVAIWGDEQGEIFSLSETDKEGEIVVVCYDGSREIVILSSLKRAKNEMWQVPAGWKPLPLDERFWWSVQQRRAGYK